MQSLMPEIRQLHDKKKQVFFCPTHNFRVENKEDICEHNACIYVSLAKTQLSQIMKRQSVSDLVAAVEKDSVQAWLPPTQNIKPLR